jgi:NADP-dependent 3-hydroxy acid dehydrogenase YdfG
VIKDKVVVITGASSGIGQATAVMLAERGAKVVLGARGLDRLQSLARRIERAGGEVAYAQTDVRKREDLTSLVNLACERYGQLDVLINNAGIGPISPLDDLRVEDWENMIDIEVFSTASPQRCRCFVSRVSDISSTPLLRPALASTRTWRFMPARSLPCARSPKACARRRATSCA